MSEALLTATAAESPTQALYHGYYSLEHSVTTLGARAECQLPPCSWNLSHGPFKRDEFARTPDSYALSTTAPHPYADHKSLVIS